MKGPSEINRGDTPTESNGTKTEKRTTRKTFKIWGRGVTEVGTLGWFFQEINESKNIQIEEESSCI